MQNYFSFYEGPFDKEPDVDIKKIKSMVDGIPFPACAVNFKKPMRVFAVNNSLLEMLKFAKSDYEFCINNGMQMIHPDDEDAFIDHFVNCYDKPGLFSHVCRLRCGDGSYKWINVKFSQNDYLISKNGMYIMFDDVDEEINLRKEFDLSKNIIYSTLKSAKMQYWEYNVEKGTCLNNLEEDTVTGLGYFQDFPNSFLRYGIIHEDSIDDFLSLHDDVINGSEHCERILKINDGDFERFVRVIYNPIFDNEGKVSRAVGVGIDVSPIVEAEKKYFDAYNINLRHNQKINEADGKHIGSVANLRINLTRNVFEKCQVEEKFDVLNQFLESPYDEIYGYVLALVSQENKKEFRQKMTRKALLEAFKKGNRNFNLELKIAMESGTIKKWFRMDILLASQYENNDVLMYISAEDIDDVRVSNELMESIVKKSYDMVAYIDGRFDRIITSFFGDVLKDISGAKTFDNKYSVIINEFVTNFVVKEQQKEAFKQLDMSNVLLNLSIHDEYVVHFDIIANEEELKKEVRFKNAHMEYSMFFVNVTDVTLAMKNEQKKIKMLNDALKKAKDANKAKTDFLSRISHDIRTPMNAVIGMIDIAKESLDDQASLENCIDKIDSASKYLLLLINNILDMSKIEQGKIKIENVRFDAYKMINNIRFIFAERADQNHVSFEISIDGNMWRYYIGDELHISEIIMNLLSNSQKFTEPGGFIKVSMWEEVVKDDDINLMFEVEDNGCGMSEEFQKKMFEPFEQENAGARKNVGTGRGLSIVKHLVDLMKGKISVESKLGEGTKFSITLPLERSSVYEDEITLGDSVTMFNGENVLLVEDNELNMEIAKNMLESFNLTVHEAWNGQEAVDIFEEKGEGFFKVLFMDIRMPILDGFAATKKIRKLGTEYAETVPVVAMSANAFSTEKKKAKGAGINHYITKPIDKTKVNTVISLYL